MRSVHPQGFTFRAHARVSPLHQAACDNAYQWLLARITPGGLIDSYEDNDDIAYTYDQALAAIAFALRHDIAHARKTLDALQSMQRPDGAWYTAYYCHSHEVQQTYQHAGPILWVTLAIAHYERATGDLTRYRATALNALRWVLQFQQADGGINGGYELDGSLVPWCSTEHNQDAYGALTYFGLHNEAAAVKSFLDNQTWDRVNQRFMGGRGDPRDPLDVNAWGIAALGASGPHAYANSLDYALLCHRSIQSIMHGNQRITIDGFDFNSDKDDIWFEGQSEMALAFKLLGREAEADHFIGEIIKIQQADGGTGVRYSLKGSYNDYWTMADTKSVSASAWLIFAIYGFNPLRP
jgi:hypothetical protein